MGKKVYCALALVALVLSGCRASREVSCLSEKAFDEHWVVESEAADYAVTFSADTVDIGAPKGLTMWWREKLGGAVRVEYDAQVVLRDGGDRLSDLNCFWMANDPGVDGGSVMERLKERTGVFVRCYTMTLYYVGYGGNSNRTTRFRRYDGDARGVGDVKFRPAILKEYTDADHLLKANHWYHVVIECDGGGRTTYSIDGETLVDYVDAEPYLEGWFGFRTTKSHVRVSGFRVTRL